MTPADLGSILSIWAHPDDETYLAGATMAAAVDAGQRVTCVSLTAGERGTDDPLAWPPWRLAQLRRWESAAAMAVLGVTDHRVLDLPDGGLASLPDAIGVAVVAGLLDELDPDTVLTFGPDGQTFHPDHVAVSRWVTAAARGRRSCLLHATTSVERHARFGQRWEDAGIYMTDERPVPTPPHRLALQVTVGGAALDRKVAALAAMASQTEAIRHAVGPAVYADLAAEESFVLWQQSVTSGT